MFHSKLWRKRLRGMITSNTHHFHSSHSEAFSTCSNLWLAESNLWSVESKSTLQIFLLDPSAPPTIKKRSFPPTCNLDKGIIKYIVYFVCKANVPRVKLDRRKLSTNHAGGHAHPGWWYHFPDLFELCGGSGVHKQYRRWNLLALIVSRWR